MNSLISNKSELQYQQDTPTLASDVTKEKNMNIKSIFTLLLILLTVMLAGCYTKLGYYEAGYLEQKQSKHIENTEKEIEAETEGYYGHRKPIYRNTRSKVSEDYWVPFTPHLYSYYPPYAYSYYHPWYYGYHTPYYGYYPPYRSYGPYRGYYGRYTGSRVHKTSRGTYKNRAVSKGQRRAQYTRSVTSRNALSERSQGKRR